MAIRFAILSFLTVILAFLAQQLWIQSLPLFGVGPQIMLIAVIYYSLHYGELSGELFGFVCGMFLDVFSISVIGTQAMIFTLAGYICGRLSHRIDEASVSVQVLLSFAFSYFQSLMMYLVSKIFLPASLTDYRNFVITPLYTAIVSAAIFKIIEYWMELVEKWSGKMNQK